MNRKIAVGLAVGSAAAVAAAIVAATPGNAWADAMAEYTLPLAASNTRGEVKADRTAQRWTLKSGAGEWALQDHPPQALRASSR